MTSNEIIITDVDLQRLLPVLDLHDTPASDALATELYRAVVVSRAKVPADVITMNSEVTYEDCVTAQRRTVRVVFPKDADATNGRVSVLAPIGSALLGLRIGQEIEWQVPTGTKRIRVVDVRYQPEAAGDDKL